MKLKLITYFFFFLSNFTVGHVFSANIDYDMMTSYPLDAGYSYQFVNLIFDEGTGKHYFRLNTNRGLTILSCDDRLGCGSGSDGIFRAGDFIPVSMNFDVRYFVGNFCGSGVINHIIDSAIVYFNSSSGRIQSEHIKRKYTSKNKITRTIIGNKNYGEYYAFALYKNYLYRITLNRGLHDQEKNYGFNYYGFFTKQLDKITIDTSKTITKFGNIPFDKRKTLEFINKVFTGDSLIYVGGFKKDRIRLDSSRYYLLPKTDFVSIMSGKKLPSYCFQYDLFGNGTDIYLDEYKVGYLEKTKPDDRLYNEIDGGPVLRYSWGELIDRYQRSSGQDYKTKYNPSKVLWNIIKPRNFRTKNGSQVRTVLSCGYTKPSHGGDGSCGDYYSSFFIKQNKNNYIHARYYLLDKYPLFYEEEDTKNINLYDTYINKWNNLIMYGF